MSFKIGIVADSHGEAEKIEAAISFLGKEGCQTVYHLGDICDSYNLSESADCIRLLRDNRVQAIKGNNDHVITRYHVTHENLSLSRAERAFLNHLPLVREYRNAVFAHSLPFERQLGLSCMIRPLDELQIDIFFRRFPGKMLFRGHSHEPEIISNGFPDADCQPLLVNKPVYLGDRIESIITCGALTDNLCVVWWPDEQQLVLLTFPSA